ncbi:hypothetical protein N802_11215 [Knoellia sinensis KCTC 19936]|uniref:AMIN-like domain-containing protein n=1 Tax=Knoellia sinensis KCTC 19936 TaxID=1385520 RepID=A0A0A0J4L1_9MICO|nr:hypothetical protein [Knoellia sinensis]KGN32143.1 hypothetical protein N802_11215 [Knoellia sinensis KCTC 19936]
MNRRTIRRSAAALALGLVASTAPAAVGASSASAAPYCGITWGSLTKSSTTMKATTVRGLRAGRHACFDRLVIDQRGPATGYHVRYVPQVTQDGSGNVVPVAGGAKLQVITRAARYTTPPAMPNVSGFRTFRQVKWAGSFEGQSTVGLGVRARLPFRVFTINDRATGTSRLVIDVAHRW